MADLDDFFAKKDRKKAKGKKFTTTDEVAKKLEETGKRLEKPKPKEKPANPEGEESQHTEVRQELRIATGTVTFSRVFITEFRNLVSAPRRCHVCSHKGETTTTRDVPRISWNALHNHRTRRIVYVRRSSCFTCTCSSDFLPRPLTLYPFF